MHASVTTVLRLVLLFSALILAPAFGGELYVGADYHPHDSDPQTWARDIALMQQGGFRVVRLGHLAWDSYEPRDGEFDFAWFDDVMNRMNAAGIKVILDLAVRPAPLWLHRLHPSIDVVDVDGARQYPNHRYMEDVGDPYFQQYAMRFADALVKRYAKHPALIAFGIDNEPGDGPISYSPAVRARFITWLRQKYGTVDALNRAWAGQRWSRRIGDFEEVGLPMSSGVKGQPERVLDFRRFISDEVNGYLVKLLDVVHTGAPGVLTTTNMWYYSPMKYFDYAPIAYSGAMTRGGCGYYPGVSLRHNEGIYDSSFGIVRIQYENTTPFWCTEFISATATPGAMRKAAYASLMYGNQMACVWTWQSMHAGEEQFLEGLVDWDGRPNRKYDEYKQVAAEFSKIAPYGFPYQPKAQVALAFSFPSQIASASFPEPHDGQVENVFTALTRRNIDVRMVDVTRSTLPYKVLFVPGMAIMDEPSAAAIRGFVQRGGTVVMTSYSAMLDEHHQVFHTTLPGRLSDVFGIRVANFEETEWMNERSRDGWQGQRLRVAYNQHEYICDSPRFDVIEPKDADVLCRIVSLEHDYPIVTSHRYGAGRAIYIGLPARDALLDPLINDLIAECGLDTGPAAPAGVMARQIDATHRLYLNLEGTTKKIDIPGAAHSILRDADYRDRFELRPFEPDFIEQK